MAIFKDYSDDILEIKSEIKQLQSIVANQSDDDIKTLVNEVVKIRQMLSIPNEKVAEKPKPSKKEGHISNYTNYSNYALPRAYDLKKEKFVSANPTGNGRRTHINLNFQQLVALVKGHRNGLTVSRMKKTNPIFKNVSIGALQNYLNYWRAGSFNQAIRDNARKLGYSPDKLVSKEVEQCVNE